jgi:hypothetical protein
VLNLITHNAVKTYEEWRYSSTYSYPRHWMEVKGQFQDQATLQFTRGEGAPGTKWIGSWVDLGAGLDPVVKKKSPVHGTTPSVVQRSPSLYRLSYRAFQVIRR